MSVSLPAACPYLPLPAVSQGRVRDLSLTDFPGQPLLVFFYPADWCDTEDLLELAAARPRFRRAGCQLLACSTDSAAVHKQWVSASRAAGGLGGQLDLPLLSDRAGLLSGLLGLQCEEEGGCQRALLLVDERNVMRSLTATDLPMQDLIHSALNNVKTVKEFKAELPDKQKGKEGGLLDKLWRKNIKLPDTPQVSMQRSLSAGRARGSSEPRAEPRQGAAAGRAVLLAEELVAALQAGWGGEVELASHSAGQLCLAGGRVGGLGRVKLAGPATLVCNPDSATLTFPLVLRGLSASYSFSGRRVRGELACNYEECEYRVTVSQAVCVEPGPRPALHPLQLTAVRGVRMDVTGFGPLNWLAGKQVTELVQGSVLQAVETELSASLTRLLANITFYFQAEERASCSLAPAGILVC